MPNPNKAFAFILIYSFALLWLKSFGVNIYYFSLFAVLSYIYSCDLIIKIEEGRIKDSSQMLKDLAGKLVISAMAGALIMLLSRKV
ncbi:MAG: hypothetical protein NTV63_05175 [Candidatus Woesearchaeota archaeon]|nr:hypothetical protein [Candidatus Woesearchaeota archaeon]